MKAIRGQLLVEARRIAIVGAPGSGKSTLALRLSAALNLPLYHLDDFYWLPRWRRTNVNRFVAAQRGLTAHDEWIIDGNHLATFHIRLTRADAICIMNVPTITALRGFVTRAFRRAIGDRDSLPRAIRLDTGTKWRPGLDIKTLKTLVFFQFSVRATILDLISRSTQPCAVVVVDSWQDGERLVSEVMGLRGGAA